MGYCNSGFTNESEKVLDDDIIEENITIIIDCYEWLVQVMVIYY